MSWLHAWFVDPPGVWVWTLEEGRRRVGRVASWTPVGEPLAVARRSEDGPASKVLVRDGDGIARWYDA